MIVVDFPEDVALREALRARLRKLPNYPEGAAVAAEIQKLDDIASRRRIHSALPKERVATFNRRYDVFVFQPKVGPALIVAHDTQDDTYILADIHDLWPTTDYAVAKSAAAVKKTVAEVHYWHGS
jgi:hypothetical protein